MKEEPQSLSQQAGDSISRPGSTSAAEAAVSQLLGMTGLVEHQGADEPSQDQREDNAPATQPDFTPAPSATLAAPTYNGATPAATVGGNGNVMPTCQNCSTSTTPLWRRDEYGSVLCNACGLFLKLHGRPRPISLKTDVIKSRNRVKTMRPEMAGKKKNTTPQAHQSAKRQSNVNPDGSNDSPISRTGTPSMYNQSLPSFIMDDPYSSTGVSGFGANGDGSGSPMNGDAPQTHEQLIATNSSLKTRVRELELINELFRGRLSQLEQQEAAARRGHEVAGVEQTQLRSQLEASQESEKLLRTQLDDSHRRENSLKRRLDDLELELSDSQGNARQEPERPEKKLRTQSPERSNTTQSPAPEEHVEKSPEESTTAEADAAVDTEA